MAVAIVNLFATQIFKQFKAVINVAICFRKVAIDYFV